MELLQELRERESKLAAEFAEVTSKCERIATELAMVRHGIMTLTTGSPTTRRKKWTKEKIIEAENLYESGMTWEQVAVALGMNVYTLKTALKRARKAMD